MFPDDVRVPNFHFDSLVFPDVTEAHSVPLCQERNRAESLKALLKNKLSHKGVINILLPNFNLFIKNIRGDWNQRLTLWAAKHRSSFSIALLAYSKASYTSCFFRLASMLGRRDRSRDARASLHRTSASSLGGRGCRQMECVWQSS